jgi:hypothetical protein
VQQFFQKNIFKESCWKAKNEITRNKTSINQINMNFKYVGLDEYPTEYLEEFYMKYKILVKIYLKYSNGSEPCIGKPNQLEYIKFTYEKKKEFIQKNRLPIINIRPKPLQGFPRPLNNFLGIQLRNYFFNIPESGNEKFLDHLRQFFNKIQYLTHILYNIFKSFS